MEWCYAEFIEKVSCFSWWHYQCDDGPIWRLDFVKNVQILYRDDQVFVSSEQTLPAAPYPRSYIHCVVDDLKDAVSAVCGLRAAGYENKDIHVLASWDFVQAVAHAQIQRRGLMKVLVRLTSLLDDGFGNTYLHEARKGRHVLAVRLTRSEQVEQVRDLLIFHRAQLIKYVSAWAVADLQPSLAQAWAVSVLSAGPRAPYRY